MLLMSRAGHSLSGARAQTEIRPRSWQKCASACRSRGLSIRSRRSRRRLGGIDVARDDPPAPLRCRAAQKVAEIDSVEPRSNDRGSTHGTARTRHSIERGARVTRVERIDAASDRTAAGKEIGVVLPDSAGHHRGAPASVIFGMKLETRHRGFSSMTWR